MAHILQNNDLIFYKGDNGNIMSGGYDVESHMLRNGISPMKTLNFEQNGGKEKKVSNGFENLAVPAGLYYITQPQCKTTNKERQIHSKEHTTLPDDIFDKLYEMIEYDNKKKRTTKKQNLNVAKKNKKTKKLLLK
jgi:hypothetical protein